MLENHLMSHRKNVETVNKIINMNARFKCFKCNKTFATTDDLLTCIYSHLDEGHFMPCIGKILKIVDKIC
jgi:transposase-like protein